MEWGKGLPSTEVLELVLELNRLGDSDTVYEELTSVNVHLILVHKLKDEKRK